MSAEPGMKSIFPKKYEQYSNILHIIWMFL
jgi:hypothetical protein